MGKIINAKTGTMGEMIAQIAIMRSRAQAHGNAFDLWSSADFESLFYTPTAEGRGARHPALTAWDMFNSFTRAYKIGTLTPSRPTQEDRVFIHAHLHEVPKQAPAKRPVTGSQFQEFVAILGEAPDMGPEQPPAKPALARRPALTALVNEINGRRNAVVREQHARTPEQIAADKAAAKADAWAAAQRLVLGGVTLTDFAYDGYMFSSQQVYCPVPKHNRWVLVGDDGDICAVCDYPETTFGTSTDGYVWFVDSMTPRWVTDALAAVPADQVKTVGHLTKWLLLTSKPTPAAAPAPAKPTLPQPTAADLIALQDTITTLQAQLDTITAQRDAAQAALDKAGQARGDAVRVMTTVNDLLATAATAMRSKKLKVAERNEIVTQRIDAAMDDMTCWIGGGRATPAPTDTVTKPVPTSRVADLIDSFEADWIDE